jgi:hypothetical protein
MSTVTNAGSGTVVLSGSRPAARRSVGTDPAKDLVLVGIVGHGDVAGQFHVVVVLAQQPYRNRRVKTCLTGDGRSTFRSGVRLDLHGIW